MIAVPIDQIVRNAPRRRSGYLDYIRKTVEQRDGEFRFTDDQFAMIYEDFRLPLLGDFVSRRIHKLWPSLVECSACSQRRRWLNELWPSLQCWISRKLAAPRRVRKVIVSIRTSA